jgi:hypothetical protein
MVRNIVLCQPVYKENEIKVEGSIFRLWRLNLSYILYRVYFWINIVYLVFKRFNI